MGPLSQINEINKYLLNMPKTCFQKFKDGSHIQGRLKEETKEQKPSVMIQSTPDQSN